MSQKSVSDGSHMSHRVNYRWIADGPHVRVKERVTDRLQRDFKCVSDKSQMCNTQVKYKSGNGFQMGRT